ncbi:MAG: alpha/beta fold hydrolase [Thiotrichales bacterium]
MRSRFSWGLLSVVCCWVVLRAPLAFAQTFTEPVWNSQVWFETHGERSRPPLVLIHGLSPQAGRDWEVLIPRLRERFFLVVLDLPGFGRSSGGNRLYSPGNYAAVVDALLRHLSLPRATVAGHSMGGTVALRLAADYPDRVARLVLVNAAGVLHGSVFSRFLARFGVGVLAQGDAGIGEVLGAFADQLLTQVERGPIDAAAAATRVLAQPELRALLLGGDPLKIAALALSVEDFSRDLAAVRAPTLIVWSEGDPVTPLRTGEALAARLRDARLEVIPGAQHMLMQAAPERLAELIVRAEASYPATRIEARDAREATAPADYRCARQAHAQLSGRYRHIVVEGCGTVVLDGVEAESLSVRDANLTMRNSTLYALGTALTAERARLEITASRVRGTIGMALNGVELDVAGTVIEGSERAIVTQGASRGVFSISEVRTGNLSRVLHGIEVLGPGDGRSAPD